MARKRPHCAGRAACEWGNFPCTLGQLFFSTFSGTCVHMHVTQRKQARCAVRVHYMR